MNYYQRIIRENKTENKLEEAVLNLISEHQDRKIIDENSYVQFRENIEIAIDTLCKAYPRCKSSCVDTNWTNGTNSQDKYFYVGDFITLALYQIKEVSNED